uniref:sec-independent protein translocase-like protein n=1 Tax=Gloiopeltis furcata TaxID=42017 RepID=UPI0028D045C7|nr:sec-independent protein translocase-like protein [Gloiopeltis furcata]WMP13899.1 sec-independent protein translocase-like protein [Gloiopeltis furcata]
MTKQWNNEKEMSIFEHLEELRQRIFTALLIFLTITVICFLYTKNISHLLQKPAEGIKFLQLAPGEYFFASIKVSVYAGLIISTPFTISQLVIFIIPGLTKKEASYLVPILISSISLFFTGIFFSYYILAPAALKFFIEYGAEIVEPVWSFEQYFNFILLLIFSTGIAFQIPIIQIILGVSNVFSSDQMLFFWKYAVFIATIMGAILTPSTDPITQLFMSSAIIFLYLGGIIMLKIMKK